MKKPPRRIGAKVSVNDILIKCAGLALKKVPAANASWIEDGRIALHKHADVSMAVAIEGGLITPIVKDADQKGLVDISRKPRISLRAPAIASWPRKSSRAARSACPIWACSA